MARTAGETVPSQFRLRAQTLADLDAIARHLESTGATGTRTEAIRVAARKMAEELPGKKSQRKRAPGIDTVATRR